MLTYVKRMLTYAEGCGRAVEVALEPPGRIEKLAYLLEPSGLEADLTLAAMLQVYVC
jgi:hypothetical protein